MTSYRELFMVGHQLLYGTDKTAANVTARGAVNALHDVIRKGPNTSDVLRRGRDLIDNGEDAFNQELLNSWRSSKGLGAADVWKAEPLRGARYNSPKELQLALKRDGYLPRDMTDGEFEELFSGISPKAYDELYDTLRSSGKGHEYRYYTTEQQMNQAARGDLAAATADMRRRSVNGLQRRDPQGGPPNVQPPANAAAPAPNVAAGVNPASPAAPAPAPAGIEPPAPAAAPAPAPAGIEPPARSGWGTAAAGLGIGGAGAGAYAIGQDHGRSAAQAKGQQDRIVGYGLGALGGYAAPRVYSAASNWARNNMPAAAGPVMAGGGKSAGLVSVIAPAAAAVGTAGLGYNLGHSSAQETEAAKQKTMRNRAIGAGFAAGALGPDILAGQQGSSALNTVGKLINLDRMSGG